MNYYTNNQKKTTKVLIKSEQTIRKQGEILSTNYDRVWGDQYLVLTDDVIWGKDTFWLRQHEIKFVF